MGVVCLLVVWGSSFNDKAVREASADERPNILFVLTDDMDTGLLEEMPIVRKRVAKQGVRFDNALVTQPMCCPSRATMLRGQYPHNHGVESNIAPAGGEQKFRETGHDRDTLPVWLQETGYETGLIGKYLNGYKEDEYVPPGWDEWYADAGGQGKRVNDNGTLRDGDRDRHPDDVYRDEALEFIRGADEPFYLWLGFHAPHPPANFADRHADEFRELKLPRPPSYNEANVRDKPLWVRSRPRFKREDTRRLTKAYRDRARSLQAVDEAVGDLIDLLKRQGELNNTYVVFTSDNGFHMGEHRFALRKSAPYEESIGIPLTIRGPGVKKGAARNHMVTNNDFAPTFAAWAGADAPDFVDGKSFEELLDAESPAVSDWRTATLVERLWIPPVVLDPQIPTYDAVRTRRYMYVEYGSDERELYDLREDPYQLESRHESADPELIERLKARLDALRGCAAEECLDAEGAR